MADLKLPTDWKEVKVTAITTGCVTIVTAFVGCFFAVLLAQKVVIPWMDKSAAAKKEKEATKK